MDFLYTKNADFFDLLMKVQYSRVKLVLSLPKKETRSCYILDMLGVQVAGNLFVTY